MTRLHDYGYTLRLQDFSDGKCHLLRQPLLDLKSTGEHLCEACQFGEPQYSSCNQSAFFRHSLFLTPTVWDVTYVHLDSVNLKISKLSQRLERRLRKPTFPVKGTI